MNNINYKYNQRQIANRATYHGLYLWFSIDRPFQPALYGRALKLAIAKHMRDERAASMKGYLN